MRKVRRVRDCTMILFGTIVGIVVNSVYLSVQLPQMLTKIHFHQRSDGFRDNDYHRVQVKSEHVPAVAVSSYDDSKMHDDNDTVARTLADNIRIVCIIITAPKNLESRTVYVRDTWTRRCTKALFFSSEYDDTIPTIGLNVSEGRNNLTPKHNLAFKYVYDHHFHDGDWFYKADDDTYAIMENMRYLLARYSPSDPIYFGNKFIVHVASGYPSGGSGYVLSKEAFRRFGEKGLNASLCRQTGTFSDLKLGECMEKLGVKLLPATDSWGRTTFHCFDANAHVLGRYPKWYRSYDPAGYNKSAANLSDFAISFHYVKGPKMHELEYFIYHLMPYGILRKSPPLTDLH